MVRIDQRPSSGPGRWAQDLLQRSIAWLRGWGRGTPGDVVRLTAADAGSLFLHYITLPEADRQARFHGRMRYATLLDRCRHIDWNESILLGRHVGQRLIAVAELMPTRVEGRAAMELAVSVSADWQHQGIALALVQAAIEAGAPVPVVLFTRADNRSMLRIARRLNGRGEVMDGEYRFIFGPGPERSGPGPARFRYP
jgi:GNAT superfamily N-acetyltransferase